MGAALSAAHRETPGATTSHALGLGVEQNIVTLCDRCHRQYDQSALRPAYKRIIEDYLKARYPGWNPEKLVYHKGGHNA